MANVYCPLFTGTKGVLEICFESKCAWWLEAENKCSITAFTLTLDATNRLLAEIDDSLDAIKVAIGKK